MDFIPPAAQPVVFWIGVVVLIVIVGVAMYASFSGGKNNGSHPPWGF